MVHDYSFFGSTADFVIKKKEHLGFLLDFAISKHQRCLEKYDLRVRQPASTSSKNWILRKKMEIFVDRSAFNARCKGEKKHENKPNYNC